MSAVTVRKPPGNATLEDALALPEATWRRHEVLDGDIVERGAATVRHGRSQAQVSAALVGPYGRRGGGGAEPGGWIFATEVDIYFDAKNILRPDIAGWRRERLPDVPEEFPIRLVPDWTCEILSTNKRNDLIKKKRVYHRHRVPHHWIVDPVEETLLVFRWHADGFVEVLQGQRGERVRAEPFEAVELSVALLVGGDDEP